MRERIPIGSDHAGFSLKERLVKELERLGYEPVDLGPPNADSVDYPDFAHQVAGQVERGDAERGILMCGTGLGMSYAANRHPGVRAAVSWSPEIAELSRRQANTVNNQKRRLAPGRALVLIGGRPLCRRRYVPRISIDDIFDIDI